MKFAFITPRYGGEISAGAEHACRLLAEQVCERHDVDVLTTCALDAATWRNEISEGTDRVRGVLVRRFAVGQGRDADAVRQLTSQLLVSPRVRAEELEWVRRLGPVSPGLIDHLKRQHRTYDALVFFSLWHWPTVQGLQVAPDRSILFPYLQLRPELRFGLWADLVASARAIGYFSASERRLLHSYLRVFPQHEEIVGIGIDPLQQQTYPRHQQDPADSLSTDLDTESDAPEEPAEPTYLEGRGVPFRRRHRLYGRFAVYGGRVAPDNGAEEMLEYYDAYVNGGRESAARGESGAGDAGEDPEAGLNSSDQGPAKAGRYGGGEGPAGTGRYSNGADPSALDLVLTGVKLMRPPDDPHIRAAGVLPDREQMVAYEAADVSIAPAPDDLLAQPLLESMAVGTPVLASAANETAVEHCRRANAGLYYANREEFVEALRVLAANTRLRARLGENGRRYVRQNHKWDVVLGRFDRLVSRVRPR